MEERKKREDEYNRLVLKVDLPQSFDASTFEANKVAAKVQKVALQELLDDELAERKRHLQNEKEKIETDKITVFRLSTIFVIMKTIFRGVLQKYVMRL